MYAADFIYDDIPLSSFGMVICKFDSASPVENLGVGSQIIFNTASVPGSDKRTSYGSSYSDTLTAVFQVCKADTFYDPLPIDMNELSQLLRWLNRKDRFHRFKLLQDGYETLYTYASFNVNKIEVNGTVYGLELTMTSLYPYLLEDETELTFLAAEENAVFTLYDSSDETGHIYPSMAITCHSAGNLSIRNSIEKRTMLIKNCKPGEEISIDGEQKIISTSLSSHQIQNDFNFQFFRIANTYFNRENKITLSLPCELTLRWSSIKKVGF